jgi:hypothetical protein
VFIDESGFHTSLTRLRARAPRGQRAYGKVPRNRGKNTTLIAPITLEGGMDASMTIEGATDAGAFEAYVEHFLAPTLTKEQVVLDGLGAHRTDRVRDLIGERRRCFVAALLLSGPQSDRASILKDKEHRQEGWGTHSPSFSGSNRLSDLSAHA